MRGEPDVEDLFADAVDHLLPVVTPYQFALYLLLLRQAHIRGSESTRIGKRTIGSLLGKSTRASQSNYQHIGEQLAELTALGCIVIGDTTREGTSYLVRRPREIPAVISRLADKVVASDDSADFYRDPELRAELFERDRWACRYCGERVTPTTATLDHITPVSAGGGDDSGNLATCCLMCNSIKSGRTYEEAAPELLLRVRNSRLSS